MNLNFCVNTVFYVKICFSQQADVCICNDKECLMSNRLYDQSHRSSSVHGNSFVLQSIKMRFVYFTRLLGDADHAILLTPEKG